MVRNKFAPAPVQNDNANYYAGLVSSLPQLKFVKDLVFYKSAETDIHLHESLDVLEEKLSQRSPHEVVNIQGRLVSENPCALSSQTVALLEKFPGQIVVHCEFQHPVECTLEAFDTCATLANAGIILSNRMGLIKGLNDSPEVVRQLNHQLLMMRVRPYTLRNFLWQQINLRVSEEKGLEILEALRGWTSGLAVPHYVVFNELGENKVLVPNYIKTHHNDTYIFRNYRHDEFMYREQ